jgi:hypothetical protein
MLLDVTFLGFLTAIAVAAVRRLVPRADGAALVGLLALLCGVGASFLQGGGTPRELATRGLLSGFAAFGTANLWQWGASKVPSPVSVKVDAAATEPPKE